MPSRDLGNFFASRWQELTDYYGNRVPLLMFFAVLIAQPLILVRDIFEE
jgi:hypothetical protein